MMCRQCNMDVEWPETLSVDQRAALLRIARESRAQAQMQLVKDHGFATAKAKRVVAHLASENGGCSRPGCSGRAHGAIAACPKCGSVTLGEEPDRTVS